MWKVKNLDYNLNCADISQGVFSVEEKCGNTVIIKNCLIKLDSMSILKSILCVTLTDRGLLGKSMRAEQLFF